MEKSDESRLDDFIGSSKVAVYVSAPGVNVWFSWIDEEMMRGATLSSANVALNAWIGVAWMSWMAPAAIVAVCDPLEIAGRSKIAVLLSSSVTPVAEMPSIVRSDACSDVASTLSLKSTVICVGATLSDDPAAGVDAETANMPFVAVFPVTL